ncbi:MAG: hydratase [Rhodospirillaceae bacterium]|nr:hydratase [Rhodospirillaceae bacterium]
MRFWIVVLGWMLALSGVAEAACPTESAMAERAQAYLAKQPLAGFDEDLSLEDAMCAQGLYVEALSETMGPRSGMKVGATSAAAQEMLGLSEPVRGMFLESMLVPSGSTFPADFGARPLVEADLLVRVKDEGINDATTALEAAKHLDAVIPFIELPDLTYAADVKLTGALLAAADAGARAGVMGPPIRFQATEVFLKALKNMQVLMTDNNGNQLGDARGSALLGDPMNVVLWLLEDLRKSGDKLAAGDVISLGSLSKPVTPEAGQTVTVTYIGISDRPQTVRVSFE